MQLGTQSGLARGRFAAAAANAAAARWTLRRQIHGRHGSSPAGTEMGVRRIRCGRLQKDAGTARTRCQRQCGARAGAVATGCTQSAIVAQASIGLVGVVVGAAALEWCASWCRGGVLAAVMIHGRGRRRGRAQGALMWQQRGQWPGTVAPNAGPLAAAGCGEGIA